MTYNLSEPEKQRRSELAKRLNTEKDPVTGRRKFGGAQPGAGRPRKKRASEALNEKIEDHAEEIWQRLLKTMRSNKNYEALQAIRQMMDISNKETDIQLREERNLEETSTDELVELVSSRLARLAGTGAIRTDFIDSEAVEIGPTEIDAGEGEVDEPPGSVEDSEGTSGFGTSPFARRPTN